MFTKWRMAGFYRTKARQAAALLVPAALCLSLMAGCSLLPQEDVQEALPKIRVPKISQKPEYPVKRGDLEMKVSGSGKLMSEREENLFFTEDNRRVVEVFVKAGDRVKKGQLLAKLDLGDTESQIRRKEIDLEKSELDLKEAMRTSSDSGDMLLRKQQLDHDLMKQELADLRSTLDGLKLVAPYAGTVVTFTAKVGDSARAYEKVGQIADMDALVVAVQFSSGDLAGIAPGMDARVSINTAGDFSGKVRRLPVGATQTNGNEDSLDAYALVDVPKLPAGAGHGTPLSAAIIIERRENVLSIPLAALRTQNSRNYVLVSNADGSKGEVDVEIGVKTSTDAEIIKGLAEGQKVVGK